MPAQFATWTTTYVLVFFAFTRILAADVASNPIPSHGFWQSEADLDEDFLPAFLGVIHSFLRLCFSVIITPKYYTMRFNRYWYGYDKWRIKLQWLLFKQIFISIFYN